MKTLILALTALALASPASAYDLNDFAAQQQQQMILQQQQQTLQQMQMQQNLIQQQQQAAQFNWGARCAARGYQGCY